MAESSAGQQHTVCLAWPSGVECIGWPHTPLVLCALTGALKHITSIAVRAEAPQTVSAGQLTPVSPVAILIVPPATVAVVYFLGGVTKLCHTSGVQSQVHLHLSQGRYVSYNTTVTHVTPAALRVYAPSVPASLLPYHRLPFPLRHPSPLLLSICWAVSQSCGVY